MTVSAPTCPACRGARLQLDTDRLDSFRVMRCRACGLVFTDPLQQGSHEEVGSNPSSVTDDDYYQNIVRNFRAQSVLADAKIERLLGFYADRFGIRPRNVLEFGCGTGQYASGWAKQGISWAGVEASPRMIEFCRARGCTVMDASEVSSLPSVTFDLIYFSQVLEHVLDPRSFLQEVHRLLAHGGIVHLDVPNHASLASTLRKLNPRSSDYGFIQPPHHLIAYTRQSLAAVTAATGFNTRFMEAVPNNHRVLGQLMVLQKPLHRVLMAIDGALGTGSLLVAILGKTAEPTNKFKASLPHE